jgi:hypothetical protein
MINVSKDIVFMRSALAPPHLFVLVFSSMCSAWSTSFFFPFFSRLLLRDPSNAGLESQLEVAVKERVELRVEGRAAEGGRCN